MRPRVLVIDDDRLVASAIRKTLHRDHDVVIEHNPSVALERLRSGAWFDAILCDLAMPSLSGVRLYAELATTHRALAARIIFIAGSFGDFALSDIPNRRIGKPYQPEMLRQVVWDVASEPDPRTASAAREP